MSKAIWVAALAVAPLSAPAVAQRAGQIIAADPVRETPDGMQAWRMTYWTTTGTGQPRRATAMVVAPREALPPTPRRVLAWTHGAWGVATRCAPSLSANFWTATAGLDAVKRGYVVVAPDYAGLGSAGVHPFLVGEDTGRAVLDAVTAARSISGAAAGTRFALWGESQGGHAALWSAQVARRYAPGLTLVGAAAAAPPTALADNLRLSANKTVRAMFMAYIGYSWANRYGAPLSTFGGAQTQGILTRLAQNNCVELHSKPRLGTVLGIVTVQNRWRSLDLGRVEPWASLARRNSVTRNHARALCRSRARLRWIDIQGSGHATSARDSAGETLAWIDDRFAGRRAPSDCGRI